MTFHHISELLEKATHQRLTAAMKGKSFALSIRPEENLSFLNWIRLDHVGSLIEIHMHALFVGATQVHVPPGDIIARPVLFLEKIHQHRVGRAFAPNFFLGELSRALESGLVSRGLDLSCLKYIVSGGEANPVSTCVRISGLLGKYGAPDNVIVPGFGMTETCAGSIYNLSCPAYDLVQGLEFASLGHCVPGIQMRVDGSTGGLELTGPIVFSGYYNNEQATADAFTADGWFKTGDTATIDAAGTLNLSGRTKELIAINGLKFLPKELEAAIEEEMIDGVTPGYVVCFATRPSRAQAEQICVVYLPTYPAADVNMRYRVQTAIARTVLLFTGSRPYILPLGERYFQRTTLGKLSASRLRLALERGDYRTEEAQNMQLIKEYQASIYSPPANKVEQAILEEMETLLGASEKTIGVNATMFEVGLTSVDLLKLKRQIEARLGLDEIALITMMKHPTVRDLANALQRPNTQTAYDPVVRLSSQGVKTPLWLIHPGVGEILVFLNLAKFIVDRPVYALRARGFNPGETHFKDIPECVATYHTAIKKAQPCGPYAIAGYSYGSMLAFEVAKVLEQRGDDVRFVGAFNLPPHIKFRMRQLDWTKCLLHLSFFLDIISEDRTQAIAPVIEGLAHHEAVAYIIGVSSDARLTELSLTAEKLEKWASLAYALQSMAQDYDPEGAVTQMDVFYCNPLSVVASSKEQWLEDAQVEGFRQGRSPVSRCRWSSLHDAFSSTCSQFPGDIAKGVGGTRAMTLLEIKS